MISRPSLTPALGVVIYARAPLARSSNSNPSSLRILSISAANVLTTLALALAAELRRGQ